MSDLRRLSAVIEHQTGLDSLDTIEQYGKSEGGAYLCPFPRCSFAAKDSVRMWRHIHLQPKHHPKGWPKEIQRYADQVREALAGA